MPFFERLQHSDQMLHIVSFFGHQVAAAEVDPLELGQECAELPLKVLQRLFQVETAAFTKRMKMQALDAVG